MKRSTFVRATVYTSDGAQSEVLIGLCDRMAAKARFKKTAEELQETDAALAEEWMAYTAYKASMRQSGSKQSFEKWLETYLGVEFDDGVEDPGTTPA